jgi:hypothetical protein
VVVDTQESSSKVAAATDALTKQQPVKRQFSPALVVAGIAAGLLAGVFAGKAIYKSKPVEPPTYRQLTFRRGSIRSARFAPDGQTILYSAAWQGNPVLSPG